MQTDYILHSSRWEHPLNAQTKNNYTAIVVYCLYYLGTTQQLNCAHVDVLLYYDFFYYNDHFKLVASLLPHSDIYLLHRPFQARSRGCVQTKTFRKDSEASSRAEGGRGYVIIFNNEPSCCYVATSERRRIQLRADYYYIALREASIRRSQRSNSEAVLFRGTLPRRYSIRRSRWGNTSPDHFPHTASSAFSFVYIRRCPTYYLISSM